MVHDHAHHRGGSEAGDKNLVVVLILNLGITVAQIAGRTGHDSEPIARE